MKPKNPLTLTIVFLLLSGVAFSQVLLQNPKASLKLKVQQDGGYNGASVAYNPVAGVYYAVMAGNSDYPLETFDAQGRNVYQAQAGNDLRGLWWNPKSKSIEGNCYADGGIVSLGLNGSGYATGNNEEVWYGSGYQPAEQSVGTFDPSKKEIVYFDGYYISGYSRKNGKVTKTFVTPQLEVPIEDINTTTVIFTGVETMEYGLLDFVDKTLFLFDLDGYQTGTVNLPADAETYDAFNFSYANGYLFLFDQESRVWTGYKIFE